MATSRPPTVRSHRRRARRRPRVAPWVIVLLVAALLVSGAAYSYDRLVKKPCIGQIKATVIAAPATATLLQSLARGWAGTTPSVNGTCAAIGIEARDSTLMAQALGTDWDPKSGGVPPDVWVPDSTAWIRRASTAPGAERMMPDLQPSLARTPAVVAMPKPMAEALGWPAGDVSWQDLINTAAADPAGWGRYGKPQWGAFRFGMTDPLKSTAGLLSLMAVLDSNDDGEVSVDEQNTLYKLKQERAVYTDTTDQILAELRKADGQGAEAALKYVSAFPALEQDVLNYNRGNPTVPLVAVYPSNGSADADNPYLVLDAPWAAKARQTVAKEFLRYVRSPAGRKTFLDAGFRDANRAAGKPLADTSAFSAKIKTLPRAVLLPESVKQSMDTWTALTRPTNVLLVLDVSGSMATVVPGTGKNRLQLAKEAATGAVNLFADDANAGLWVFSTRQDGAKDYRSLVPLGTVSEQVGGRSRREQMVAAIAALKPAGDTGLYDTAAAAHQAVIDAFKTGATNLVVLMTDGKNDDTTGGLTIDQLRDKLTQDNKNADRKVPIVTVGYGDDADFAALQEIARITGGTAYTSKTAFDINQVLLSAIFGRV